MKSNATPKLEERGITCMFVGYATDHSGDCFEMLNMQTKRIILTRDVQWLNRMYYEDSTIQEDDWRLDTDVMEGQDSDAEIVQDEDWRLDTDEVKIMRKKSKT
jgi:hypothetical protein